MIWSELFDTLIIIKHNASKHNACTFLTATCLKF